MDAAATRDADGRALGVSLVNRHPDRTVEVAIRLRGGPSYSKARASRVAAASKDSYNDVGRTEVGLEAEEFAIRSGRDLVVRLPPHSLSVLCLRA